MDDSDWESDDEAEETNVWSHSSSRPNDPEAINADDERSEYDVSGRKHSAEPSVSKGRSPLARQARSFYKVERLPIRPQPQYPDGPEVLTRLKHTGYPERTEKRFGHHVDPEEEVIVQRALIGMPTSSFAYELESEIGIDPPEVGSTEEFLMSLQNDGDDGDPEVIGNEDAVSDTETLTAEKDNASDVTADVSHYAMPSLIAHQERAWRVPPKQRLQNQWTMSSEEDSHATEEEEVESLQSEKTPSIPETPTLMASSIQDPMETRKPEDGRSSNDDNEGQDSSPLIDLRIRVHDQHFLLYTVDQLCSLLSRDDLRVNGETDAFNAACDWLLHAWDTRQRHVGRVMRCVRFKVMTPFELRDILMQSPNPIALNVHVIFELLHALLYLALKTVNCHEPGLGPVPVPRTCLKKRSDSGRLQSSPETSEEDTNGSSSPSTRTNYTRLLDRSSLATDHRELLTSTTTLAFESDGAVNSSSTSAPRVFRSDHTTGSSSPSSRTPPGTAEGPGRLETWIRLPSAPRVFQSDHPTGSSTPPSVITHPAKPDARVVPRTADGLGRDPTRPLREKKLTRNAAARRIQAGYRGHVVRKHVRCLDAAAMDIQRIFRGHLVRQELLRRENAAAVIQRGYRRYNDHKKYYFLTAAASYSPAARANEDKRPKWPQKPCFYQPSDPAVICFGGITTDPRVDSEQVASCIYGFDIQSDEWQLCGSMPEPRADAAACWLGGSLILTGGCDPTVSPATSTATAWRLDVVSGEWEIMPSMLQARRLHGQVIANGKVYVVGGCGDDGSCPLGSTEFFDPQTDRWIRVASMEVPRFAAAVASHCGNIWVCGGIVWVSVDSDRIRKITHLVEIYDPEKDKWSKGKPLPAPRAFCDLASVEDKMLIVVGGVEGSFQNEQVDLTSTILVFDFVQRGWRYLMNLPGNRYKAKVVSRDPYWFVVGGQSTISGPSLSTVECFDTHDQRWVAIPHLPISLHGTCCVSFQ